MPSTFSFWAIALIMTSLFASALSFRAPVDEFYKRKSRFEAKQELTKRLVCIEDDVLLSFQEYSDDSVPFCISYLSIPQQTAVSTITTRTTIIALATTTQTSEAVATVASSTVTITITPAPVAPIRKRQGLVPAAQIIASCTDAPNGLNLSLISQASNACSCLFIPQTTVTLSTTETSTRTEEGIDFIFATETTSTVTAGKATVTVTVLPIAPNTTFFAGSTGAALPLTTLASVTVPPSINTTGTGSSDFNPTPGTIVGPPRAGSDLPSSTESIVPSSVVPPFSVNTTGPLPGSSGLPNFGSITGPPRAGSDLPSSTETIVPSSVVPPSSVNTTGPLPGSSGLPNPGTITGPPRAGSDLPSAPTGASSGIPTISSNFTFPAYTSPSGAPTTPTNGSSPTTSGSAPSSTSSDIGCPVKNGSLYTTNGQTFEILCDTNFIGPDIQGLYVPSFYDCINECANVNLGFSQNSCYAASYIPNNGVGSDCFFRNQNDSGQPEFDPKATSAILINNTLSTNITASVIPVLSPSASPTNSLNSSYPTGPTAYPSASDITSYPYTSTVYENATASLSASPTNSANLTVGPSAFPTLSINSSSLPDFPFPTGSNGGRDGGTLPPTGGASTGFPSPTGNSSSCSGCYSETTSAIGATITVTDYVTEPGYTEIDYVTVTVTVLGGSSATSVTLF